MRSANTIRKDFVSFFEKQQHRFIPSSPVVPQDDPTLLFTNAGMNQFKSVFLGDNPQNLTRAANSQKCMRVSGKHNDLEEVGRDHYHHTFFEMLGNWSFGDYYKKEAITWAWELLTNVWKLSKERLFVTIHTSDDEAEHFWKTETDIEHHRIMRFGDASNFWEMGETGPCGPCSEIHYDTGDEKTRDATFSDPVFGVNGQNARYRELWNLVFMQYNREKGGALNPLPSKHVDTGMGFERICSVIQGVESNYDTDIFRPIITEIERLCGKKYDSGTAGTPYRVIADHIRALTFAITDGAFPSNEGRGYVLRRLLRRASRFGRELGFKEPFLHKIVDVVIGEMGEAFPEITGRDRYVKEVIQSEEQRFLATLDQGIEKFSFMADQVKKTHSPVLPGSDVFALYDTYGFPMDLTRLMAAERGMTIDEKEYDRLMDMQKNRAREARKNDDGLSPEGWIELKKISGSEFIGYDRESCPVTICRYKSIEKVDSGVAVLLVFDKTPFYAESGGQVGDKGILQSENNLTITIDDTIKWNDLIVHRGIARFPVSDDHLQQPFTAEVTHALRLATRRNHSVTHLLQAALRKTLGNHVQQAGSKVEPAGLRFDFTHFRALSAAEIDEIEQQVNEWVLANLPVKTTIEDLDEAKTAGATALFGEKYGDKVRVVSIAPVSKELCGGTHVSSTGEIGLFHITSEASTSAGVRRIEAITGMKVFEYLAAKERIIGSLTAMLKVPESKLHERIAAVVDTVKSLEFRVQELSTASASADVAHLVAMATTNEPKFPWLTKDLGSMAKDAFIQITDAVSDTIKNENIRLITIVLAATVDGKALFAAGAGSDSVQKLGINCGELVKIAAQATGGGGGGSPFRAQAGGRDPLKIGEALNKAAEIIRQKVARQ